MPDLQDDKKQLVDTFLKSYGDKYKGILPEDELRRTLLALRPSQLMAFIAESANGFDFADLEAAEHAE